ncbi:hypothetical protein H1P_1050009 [Hyella patelloides LEGE 07179]|uniref:Uncharacterized protein n=1 Tax=Hyella patelloides LEGE 07179 TaxID=945734 RepID=A0A563VJ39_9CYAN|nr:hypothetical protein H1P_1050009 [Hyella patelloides LEGE 07179]
MIYIFTQTRIIAAIVYLIYVILISFPLGYLKLYLDDIGIDEIEN